MGLGDNGVSSPWAGVGVWCSRCHVMEAEESWVELVDCQGPESRPGGDEDGV